MKGHMRNMPNVLVEDTHGGTVGLNEGKGAARNKNNQCILFSFFQKYKLTRTNKLQELTQFLHVAVIFPVLVVQVIVIPACWQKGRESRY